MDEEWTDAEIRGLTQRIAMRRRRVEIEALARRKQPRPLVAKRAPPIEARRPSGLTAKRKRLAG